MKTKNKIISIFMCLCLAVLSGCSQDGGGEPVTGANPANTSAAGNAGGSSNSANTEGNAADTESNGAEVTEAENRPVDERFAYYDLLSEEYDKSGKLYQLSSGNVINGKAIFITLYNGKVKTYDCKTKSDIGDFQFDNFYYDFNGGGEHCFYADVDGGYIYRTPSRGNLGGTIYKYDIGGNLIGQLDTSDTKEALDLLFTDGTFITHSGNFDDRKYYLYSEDWKTKTELPPLQYDAGHGIMEKINEYDVAAKYKNKIYVYTSGSVPQEHRGCYFLNTDTGTWEHVESELQDISYSTGGSSTSFENVYKYYTTVGRYFIIDGRITRTPGMIYDMETDTVIANTAMQSYFGLNYQGGKSTLYIISNDNDGKLCRSRFPSDGSDEEAEIILESEELSYSSESWKYAVNEEYYLFVDKYGAFLRTYKDGENGEIAVMMFENQ